MLEHDRTGRCAASPARRAHGHRDGEVADFQRDACLVLQSECPCDVLLVNGKNHLEQEGGRGVIGDLINGLTKSAIVVGSRSSRAHGSEAGGLNGLPRAAGQTVFDKEIAQSLGGVVSMGGIGVVVAPQADDGAVAEFDIEQGVGRGGRGGEQRGQEQSNLRQFHEQDIKR